MFVFEEMGKPEYLEKKPLEASGGTNLQTQTTYMYGVNTGF